MAYQELSHWRFSPIKEDRLEYLYSNAHKAMEIYSYRKESEGKGRKGKFL